MCRASPTFSAARKIRDAGAIVDVAHERSHSEEMASNYNELYGSASYSRSRGILLVKDHAPERKES